jgi:hypothetical protein
MISSTNASGLPLRMSGTVISIDSASYLLAEADSRWLAEAIRSRYKDEVGPLDACARACLDLAEELAAESARRSPRKPIRIGYLHVGGLCGDVLDDELVQGNERLSALYRALRDYRGEPVP